MATTPRRLARQLAAVEAAIADPASDVEDLAEEGHLQQLIYQRLVASPELIRPVLNSVPRRFRRAVRANLRAGLALGRLSASPPKQLPPWRIVAPPRAEKLRRYYARAARASNVRWAYLAAIHLVETRMSRIVGDSTAGAQGPMQFIPETWARFGRGDVRDTRPAIMAAARYLAASGAPRDMAAALYSYNNSTHYVEAVQAYARHMLEDPLAFRGYYHWQVYYARPAGPLWLREGYDRISALPSATPQSNSAGA
ncbi:MAG: transglycosylase SLT domain-containing protein [Egibacteraceae bacterium]